LDANAIGYMQRALALARKGSGLASPNPMVGCVLVREGQIVGEGFHQYEWREHAEVVAIKSAGAKARGATMYVTLEPCNHTGRTGPCTEAIIAAGIQRVVATIADPNPAVAGGGFKRLADAGVEVFTGVLEDEARHLNEPFAKWIRTKTPLVTLKSAMTLDGQLALPQRGARRRDVAKRSTGNKAKRRSSTWITSEESRAEVQRMRHASDALLTGIGTVLADDPLLTDRSGLSRRRTLLRVILDSKLRLSPRSRIVKTADDDLLVFTNASLQSANARALQKAGVEIVSLNGKSGRRIELKSVLKELGRRDILSVLLEAGSALNGAALAAGVVDKVFLFYAPKLAGDAGVPFAKAPGSIFSARRTAHVKNAISKTAKVGDWALRDLKFQQFGPDFALEGTLHDVYGNY
jgi:diaminohydroxyphosphoribosylaminopyrimidine deaminase/5-amino-6-(5-phosphoribosylamino)uracil reductase